MDINIALNMIDEYLLSADVNKDWQNCLNYVKWLMVHNKELIGSLVVINESLREQLKEKQEFLDAAISGQETLQKYHHDATEIAYKNGYEAGVKEFAERITEVFLRYAHLHSYAEGARKDYIETVDGKEIEMQSVWDVITLRVNGIAEYEEMSRLQKNIETIEKERLLTELEKDFRLLAKELTGGSEK